MVVFHATWTARQWPTPQRYQICSPGSRGLCITTHASSHDVVVVGGGAAGLTAAYFAAQQPGCKVLVLEKNAEAGRKILISGGTRCNVLPSVVDIEQDYFTESSRSALRAVFSTWDLASCRSWLERDVGIALALEEATGKLFPASNSAAEVRDRLLQACGRLGACVRYGSDLAGLDAPKAGSGRWRVRCNDGSVHEADAVVVATGGLSFPVLGASDAGQRALGALGHTVAPLFPALTPLRGPHPGAQQLAGLSLYQVAMHCDRPQGRGQRRKVAAMRRGMVFTHRGFSGPAVLDLSHHLVMAMERGEPVPQLVVNWGGDDVDTWRARLAAQGPGLVVNTLRKHGVPQRLAEALCAHAGVDGRSMSAMRKAERQALVHALTSFPLPCTGHEGYSKAEVTGGGVPLAEVDCRTMQSRLLPGCFACGEVLDVHGRIGGYNFFWAWLTGRAAGRAAARHALMQDPTVDN